MCAVSKKGQEIALEVSRRKGAAGLRWPREEWWSKGSPPSIELCSPLTAGIEQRCQTGRMPEAGDPLATPLFDEETTQPAQPYRSTSYRRPAPLAPRFDGESQAFRLGAEASEEEFHRDLRPARSSSMLLLFSRLRQS